MLGVPRVFEKIRERGVDMSQFKNSK